MNEYSFIMPKEDEARKKFIQNCLGNFVKMAERTGLEPASDHSR